jgi:Ca2+-binding RTX toxin-like protein
VKRFPFRAIRPLLEPLEDRCCPALAAPAAAGHGTLGVYAIGQPPVGTGFTVAEPPAPGGSNHGVGGKTPGGTNAGWIEYDNGVVKIHGSNLADTAGVQYTTAFGGGVPSWVPTSYLKVTLSNSAGSTVKYYYSAAVTAIEFRGHGAADSLGNYSAIPSIAWGGAGNDTLQGGLAADDLRGGDDNDVLRGGNLNDSLYGGLGNDSLEGESGDDTLAGNDDDDTLLGGGGDDLLSGGLHNDTLFGDAGEDTLHGDGGDDFLKGGDDGDELFGTQGDDTLNGEGGEDDVQGDSGDDHLQGGEDDDTVGGGTGHDTVQGNDGQDYLTGGDDNDHLYGHDNADTLIGGEGHDFIFGGSGHDYAEGGDGNDAIQGDGGDDYLHGSDDNDTLYGSEGDDTLFGDGGNDHLQGAEDDDVLYGHEGDDSLEGGSGMDGLFGGVGYDTVNGGTGADRILTFDLDGAELAPFAFDHDMIVGLFTEDAVVQFASGDKDWTHEEVELADLALRLLHHHASTQGTQLLRAPDGGWLTFVRQTTVSPDAGYPAGPYGGWYEGGGQIAIADHGMGLGLGDFKVLVLRQVGLVWQDMVDADFMAVSGWVQTNDPYAGLYLYPGLGGWWYAEENSFMDGPASLNPWEDFASTFAYYFLINTNSANGFFDDKLDWMGDMIAGL